MDLPNGEPRKVPIIFSGDPKQELRLSQDRPGGLTEYKVSPNGKNRSELLILLNSGPDREYYLPFGDWNLAIEQGRATQERKVSGRVMAGGTAVTFFYR